MTIIQLDNARIFDGQRNTLTEARHVIIEDKRIREVDGGASAAAALTIDLSGRVLMPGLIDAHFHAVSVDLDIGAIDRMRPSILYQHARIYLEDALQRGFTTVRDAGGADAGLAQATASGLIKGPRVFPSGRAISQTGGHGDMRDGGPVEPCLCGASAGYEGVICVVADGEDQMRQAVREELRLGATQIKLMMSGGVLSPSDPVWMDQYSDGEIRVAVEEAATRRTYVMAHAHTASSVKRCAALGVRSIEHASLIDDDAAAFAAERDCYVVPTLATVQALKNFGPQAGLPAAWLAKLDDFAQASASTLETCTRARLKVGFGTDLIGPLHDHQMSEFELRADVLSPFEILRSATSTNAEILQMEGALGVIAPGAIADLLVVDGNPLEDLSILTRPGGMPLIMKDGAIIQNSL